MQLYTCFFLYNNCIKIINICNIYEINYIQKNLVRLFAFPIRKEHPRVEYPHMLIIMVTQYRFISVYKVENWRIEL